VQVLINYLSPYRVVVKKISKSEVDQ
jgi:hypothetical protein